MQKIKIIAFNFMIAYTLFFNLYPKINVGIAKIKGSGPIEMEDRHCIDNIDCLDHHLNYFGVFDGHGRTKAAEYAKENLHFYIAGLLCQHKKSIIKAIKEGFIHCDKTFPSKQNIKHNDFDGTTATVLLLSENEITVGNVGDSRTVLCRNNKAVELTRDHTLDLKDERERVIKAGGTIENNRVYGELQITKSSISFEHN